MAAEDLKEYAAKVAPLFETTDRRDTDTIQLLLDAIYANRADRAQHLLDLGQKFLDTSSATGLVCHGGIHVFSKYLPVEVSRVFVRYYDNAPEKERLQFRTVVNCMRRIDAFQFLSQNEDHPDIASRFFISVGCIPTNAHGRVVIECGRAKVYQPDAKDIIGKVISIFDSDKDKKKEELLTVSQELLKTCKDLQAQKAVLEERVRTLDVELKSSQDIKVRIREILRGSAILNE